MARDPVLPSVRAAAFTAVCLGLGAGAHLVMSESGIPLSMTLYAGFTIYGAALLGTRREQSLLGISVLMGGLQVALHLLFEYAQSPMPASGTAPGGAGGAAGGGCLLPPLHTAVIGMSGARMLLAHVLAAVLCACWLRQGEAAVHALARSAGSLVLSFILAPLVHLVLVGRVERRRPRVSVARRTPRSQWLRGSRPLRGPPLIPSFG